MSTALDEATATETGRLRKRRRRGWTVLPIVVVLAAAAVVVNWTHPGGVDFAHPLGRRHHGSTAQGENTAATSTATVTRRTLSARTNEDGTLGYAGSYTVLNQANGTLTWLPAVGQVIHQGEVLYRVDGAPVVLLYGSTPAYRTLAEGAEGDDVTGEDVAQLNRDLVALGYGKDVGLDPSSDAFGWTTKVAIEQLQKALDLKQTGTFELGQVVFLPTAVRVTSVSATLGGPSGGAVFTATSTTRRVTVNLDASLQSAVKVGERVSIMLPNGQTTPGTVSLVGTVATAGSSGGSPTVEVDITPTDAKATGTLDKAPVQVAITTDSVRDVLAVPVNALIALAGGGYAVEVVAADGVRHLVPVTLGLTDDVEGLVQVTGSGLAVGQRVVVPAS